MAIIIQKFGGTSVGDINKIKNVANIIKSEAIKDNKIVAIVSAMAGVTDQLIKLTKQIDISQNEEYYREYDQIISTGEQVSSGLLAIALNNIGIKSKSYLGWQLRILTDKMHSKALIKSIDSDKILSNFHDNQVIVIAGFQGVTEDGEITTLGRGGSDTSAVAMAVALNAKRCDIYTDVSGIYTADPNIVQNAKKIEQISYCQILEMASLGAKVLQTRSVILAMKHKINLNILSSFNNEKGTNICMEGKLMEGSIVKSIVCQSDQILFTINKIQNSVALLNLLADFNIKIDIVNKITLNNNTYMNFSVYFEDLERTLSLIEGHKSILKYENYAYKLNLAKISIIGIGINSLSDTIAKALQTLNANFVEVHALSSSETKISILVDKDKKDVVVNELHDSLI